MKVLDFLLLKWFSGYILFTFATKLPNM